jgi:hypothetical protein
MPIFSRQDDPDCYVVRSDEMFDRVAVKSDRERAWVCDQVLRERSSPEMEAGWLS